MRKRILRTVVAVLLSVGITLPIGARPAYAIDWGKVIDYAVNAVLAWNEVSELRKQLEQAKQEILNALSNARADILLQIDQIAVADARACATRVVTIAPGMDSLNPDVLQGFALDSIDCVTRIDSLIGTVAEPRLNDQLGIALNTIVPLTQLALQKANITNVDLLPIVANADTRLVSLLEPPCSQSSTQIDPEVPLPRPGEPVEWEITCQAYNNDYGYTSATVPWPRLPSTEDQAPAKNQATRNTSRAIALAVLPMIRP